ncbi:MAG: sensor domain-containing diguanylate cyclase [Betaproteobacteria bacterium]|nr:sensor domain-containing diguanylate cyclase [Betaproteobacteria bacterium]
MNIQNPPSSLTHLSTFDLIEENTRLHNRLDKLLRHGHENQQILSRNHEMSLKLIGSDTFTDLIQHIFVTMKNTTQLEVISLILLDPRGELTKLVSFLGIDTSKHPHFHLVRNMESFHPSLASLHQPILSPFCSQQHRGLFTAANKLPKSVAVIPLQRYHRLTGFICMGDMDPNRFVSGMATDFLQLQGSIMAICLENVIAQEKLKQVSLTDSLTGIGNRRHLEEQMLKELSLAQRRGSSLSCLFIDIDKFKLINDRLGHPVGDEVLKELAQRIKNELRNYDIPARFGGEEFVLILPNTELPDAKIIAERIRLAISDKAFALPDQAYCDVTISIGGYTISGIEPGQNLATLSHFILSQADLALYEAKEGGRNQVVWAD